MELVFIGPELHDTCPANGVSYHLHTVSSASEESSNTSRPRVATCSFHHALYHDFVATNQSKKGGSHSAAPDLVVLLNPGIHFYASWQPTLRCILGGSSRRRNFSSRGGHDNNVKVLPPAVFTAWAMPEAVMTHHILEEQLAETTMQLSLPHINPWSSLLPRISPDNNCMCQFNDHYVTHFSGSSGVHEGPDIVRHRLNTVSTSNLGSSKRARRSSSKRTDPQQSPMQGGNEKQAFSFNFFEASAADDKQQTIAAGAKKVDALVRNDPEPSHTSNADGRSGSACEVAELSKSSSAVTKHERLNKRSTTLPTENPKAFSFNFFGEKSDLAGTRNRHRDLESHVVDQASSQRSTAKESHPAKPKRAAKGFAFNFFD